MNQISLRIALAMIPVLAVMLTLFGVATAAREGEVIALEMQRDADAVALSVADLLGRTGRGPVEARAEVERLDARLEHLSIAVTAAAPPVSDGDMVVGAAPLGDAAWIVVTEPLDERDAYVVRALITDALGVLVATIVAAVFAVAVGRTLVQRRVLSLITRLEEVGRGEFSEEPLQLGQDELGQLGHAVHEMSAQLRGAQHTAQIEGQARRRAQLNLRRADRLAAVGRTVAVFAHEVGTPLGVIVGRAERLERGVEAAKVTANARIIREQGDRINVFVRRLLDYARNDHGLELAPTPLQPVVHTAMGVADDRARAREVRIELSVGGDVVVDADAHALTQVFTNLLLNAVDASPPGSTVRMDVERAVDCAAAEQRGLHGTHAHVVIEDEGPGIPADVRERVFDPFFSTKGAGEGTGLGLAIVAEIVLDHGGAVTLDAAAGGGCRAVVHLPLAGGEGG